MPRGRPRGSKDKQPRKGSPKLRKLAREFASKSPTGRPRLPFDAAAVEHCTIAGYRPKDQAAECWFNAEEAARAVGFFEECLHHVEGDVAGLPFLLEPWQRNVIGTLFGWMRTDSLGRVVRRYRKALLYIPRKNGKSPLVAGIGLYLLFCDREPGAQIYCAAAEREQAAIIFRHAKGMVQREPELEARSTIYGGTGHRSIVRKDDEASSLKVLSADADTKHGGNSHGILVDELHAQPNRELVDVLVTSTASQGRKQPLVVLVTTADFDRPSICNEEHEYAGKVRDGIISDPSYFPIIFESKASDDWRDERTWAAANPNLGVSVSLDYLRRECKRAQETPVYENTFKRLHLNIRTAQDVRLIVMEDYDQCPRDLPPIEALRAMRCFGALDLSSTSDLTAFVLYFPEIHAALCRFWIPAATAEQRERRDRVPYLTWTKQGLIETTPGNVVDYRYIRKALVAAKEEFPNLVEVAYDPWNATQTAQQLQDEDGFTMTEFRQGFVSMNEPTKELLKLIASHAFNHGGNAVLRWMAANAAGKTDPADNIKIDKKTSKEKVDGLVATVMAIGCAIRSEGEEISVYATRGVITVGGEEPKS